MDVSQETRDCSEPLEKAKMELRSLFDFAVSSVLPSTLISNSVTVTKDTLKIRDKSYSLAENIYLVGFGKAVLGMAAVLQERLGSHLKRGIVSIPRGSMDKLWANLPTSQPFPRLSGSVEYRENSINNQPDEDSLRIGHEIVELVEHLQENDLLIVLISGGGSSLLYLPRPLIQPALKTELCRKLQNSGANIQELNTVRKKLSMVKGGGLARFAYPARVVSLILSDIVNDPVDLIASGPTVYSPKLPEEVIAILEKYRLYNEVDGDLKTLLTSKEIIEDKNLLDDKKAYKHVDNFVIGNNSIAIEAASKEAKRLGLCPIILRRDVVGNVQEVSEAYARIASLVCRVWDKSIEASEVFKIVKDDPRISLDGQKVTEIFHVLEESKGHGVVLIGGGEPEVKVMGEGQGGRNQELALRFSLDWLAMVKERNELVDFEVTFLSAGSDGQDGPTDAAGAFGYPAIGPIVWEMRKKLRKIVRNLEAEGKQRDDEESLLSEAEKIQPEVVLRNNDSYNFYRRFRKGKDLVKTGITGTNVMDLHFVLLKKRKCGCEIDFQRGPKLQGQEEHDLTTDRENRLVRNAAGAGEAEEKEQKFLGLKIFDASFKDKCCANKLD